MIWTVSKSTSSFFLNHLSLSLRDAAKMLMRQRKPPKTFHGVMELWAVQPNPFSLMLQGFVFAMQAVRLQLFRNRHLRLVWFSFVIFCSFGFLSSLVPPPCRCLCHFAVSLSRCLLRVFSMSPTCFSDASNESLRCLKRVVSMTPTRLFNLPESPSVLFLLGSREDCITVPRRAII